MPQVQLRLYSEPGQIEMFCALKAKDDAYERFAAVVDTGAETSLFPLRLLDDADYQLITEGTVTIDQAGIANQSFEAIEALVTITFEDTLGNETQPFQIPAWFAATDQPLIGFRGVLDRAILHIDMPTLSGWLEIEP